MSDALVEDNWLMLKISYGQTRPGLENVGETSGMNASIQALFACELFRVYVILNSNQYQYLQTYKYFSDLFIRMVRGRENVIIPDRYPQEISGEADPAAYITLMFDMIREEYYSISEEYWFPSRYPCPTDVFVGYLKLFCKRCKHTKLIRETKWIAKVRINSWDITETSSTELYKSFLNDNYFGGKIYSLCDNCLNDNMVLMTNEIPRIIILQLDYNEIEGLTIRPKLNIEEKIDINNEEYLLIACICKDWVQPEAQHYCCFVKFGPNWYYFKDKTVRESYEPKLSQSQLETAYLLFYRKNDTEIDIVDCDEVDSLIQPIQTIPSIHSSFFYEDKPKQTLPQIKSFIVSPNIPDLIGLSLGDNRGFHNIVGTCYMNASLQALFHCEPFRLHILSEWHSGRFHTQLRLLFKALADNSLRLRMIYQHFYNSFCLNVHKEFFIDGSHSKHLIIALLYELNDEVKSSSVGYHEMRPNVRFTNKPITSTDAWIQFLMAQKNSYLMRMFTIQSTFEEFCSNGHCYTYFSHSLIETLMVPHCYNIGDYIDIQMILDSSSLDQTQSSNCKECSQVIVTEFGQISRASDILMFELELNEDNSSNPDKCDNTSIRLNEFITVCSQTYFCRAIIVALEWPDDDTGHVFACVKIGHNWHCYDDRDVAPIRTNVFTDGLLSEELYKSDISYLHLVFYERLSPALTKREQQLLQSIQWPNQ